MTAEPLDTGIDFPAPPGPLAVSRGTHGLDGNRVLAGAGGESIQTMDIALDGRPLWVAAAAQDEGQVWFAVLESGAVQAFLLEGGRAGPVDPGAERLPAGAPPLILDEGTGARVLAPPEGASETTHPVLLDDGRWAYLNMDGDLVLAGENGSQRIALNALPDARILRDERGRLLLLTDPTEAYAHGVLGDMLEAESITLVDLEKSPIQVTRFAIEPGDVIEGLAPIWAEMDGDGAREIIVTQSNAESGARLVVYGEDGRVLAESEPIGQAFRWTNKLAAAQFIPGGALEIAAVRTPHIGGRLEIYSLESGSLEMAASADGYSTHIIGERNLDRALAADFNGDGVIEIALPEQDQTALAGVQFSEEKLDEIWRLPLEGKLSTNLAGLSLPDGRMMLGAGLEHGALRIFIFSE